MANDLQILSTTDKHLILLNVWQVLPLHSINRVCAIANLKSESETKTDRAFESSFNTPHINSGSLMLTFYLYILPNDITARESIEIYIFPVFPSCCVSYWNEPHCEPANQSRAQHWAALWNSQSEQSSTLLVMTLPNKVITDHFILGTNPRVVNGHVKPFLEIFALT